MMRQLYFLFGFVLVYTTRFMARSKTYESTGVTYLCDVDDCTFEGNCSKSLKRHKLTHSAALLHCNFMGCSYETKDSSNLNRHKLSHTTTVAAATLLQCDFMGCSYETKDSSNLNRHKLSHITTVAAATLLHCDFMGCSYETKDSSHLKRHKLRHTEKAQKEIAKEKVTVEAATKAEKSRACEDGIAALTVEQINTPSLPKKQRLSNQIPIHGSFEGSRNASIDAGLQKASKFFSSPNVTRATCACCNELQKAKNIRVIKAEGQWLERLKNRLTWDHTAHVVCDRTRAYYHAPETALDLKGMPLAPSGIQLSSSPEDARVNEPTDTDHVTATKSIKVIVHVSVLCINALKTIITNAICLSGVFMLKMPWKLEPRQSECRRSPSSTCDMQQLGSTSTPRRNSIIDSNVGRIELLRTCPGRNEI